MRKQIDNFIIENRDEMLKNIQELIEIPSYTENQAECKRALKLFMSKAEGFGFKTMSTQEEDVGIVEFGQGEDVVGVLIHMDVVRLGDEKKWIYPPLSGTLAKGSLWGRGAVDGKGPAIMCLYALKALKELNIILNKRIWLITCTMEEREWVDMEHFKRQFPLPKYGFCPDGDFPIYNIEKGYCDVAITFAEPELKRIKELYAGDSVNTIPSRAVMELSDGERAEVHGISCHSSVPALGVNAINKLAVEQVAHDEFNFIRFINDFLYNDYYGAKFEVDRADWSFEEQWQRTTIAPTVLRLTPEGVELNLNLRLSVNVTEDRVKQAFSRYAAKYGYTFWIRDFMKPMKVDKDEEFIQTMAQVYEEYGNKVGYKTALGTSLAKSMPHVVSWGPVFETELSCAHMENERLNIDSAVMATQMYTLFLARTASPYDDLRKRLAKMNSLEKALALLNLFSQPPYRYDVPTLAELTGMNRTTIYRDLTTLEHEGLLSRDEQTRTYTIGKAAEKMYKALRLKK